MKRRFTRTTLFFVLTIPISAHASVWESACAWLGVCTARISAILGNTHGRENTCTRTESRQEPAPWHTLTNTLRGLTAYMQAQFNRIRLACYTGYTVWSSLPAVQGRPESDTTAAVAGIQPDQAETIRRLMPLNDTQQQGEEQPWEVPKSMRVRRRLWLQQYRPKWHPRQLSHTARGAIRRKSRTDYAQEEGPTALSDNESNAETVTEGRTQRNISLELLQQKLGATGIPLQLVPQLKEAGDALLASDQEINAENIQRTAQEHKLSITPDQAAFAAAIANQCIVSTTTTRKNVDHLTTDTASTRRPRKTKPVAACTATTSTATTASQGEQPQEKDMVDWSALVRGFSKHFFIPEPELTENLPERTHQSLGDFTQQRLEALIACIAQNREQCGQLFSTDDFETIEKILGQACGATPGDFYIPYERGIATVADITRNLASKYATCKTRELEHTALQWLYACARLKCSPLHPSKEQLMQIMQDKEVADALGQLWSTAQASRLAPFCADQETPPLELTSKDAKKQKDMPCAGETEVAKALADVFNPTKETPFARAVRYWLPVARLQRFDYFLHEDEAGTPERMKPDERTVQLLQIRNILQGAYQPQTKSHNASWFSSLGSHGYHAALPSVKGECSLVVDKPNYIGPLSPEWHEVVSLFCNPKTAQFRPNAMLLYGPPGTGKTTLAQLFSFVTRFPLVCCKGTDFKTSFVSSGEQNISLTFKAIREFSQNLSKLLNANQRTFLEQERAQSLERIRAGQVGRGLEKPHRPLVEQIAADYFDNTTVVFMDEFDALAGGSRGGCNDIFGTSSGVIGSLLPELDSTAKQRIFVICATNMTPNSFDPALLRDGRFDYKIKVGMPDETQRLNIILHYANMYNCTVGAKKLLLGCVHEFADASPATLRSLVEKAKRRANLNNDACITEGYMKGVLEDHRMSRSRASGYSYDNRSSW